MLQYAKGTVELEVIFEVDSLDSCQNLEEIQLEGPLLLPVV